MEIDHPIDLLRHEINFRMSEIYGKTAMKEMYASHLKAEKRQNTPDGWQENPFSDIKDVIEVLLRSGIEQSTKDWHLGFIQIVFEEFQNRLIILTRKAVEKIKTRDVKNQRVQKFMFKLYKQDMVRVATLAKMFSEEFDLCQNSLINADLIQIFKQAHDLSD